MGKSCSEQYQSLRHHKHKKFRTYYDFIWQFLLVDRLLQLLPQNFTPPVILWMHRKELANGNSRWNCFLKAFCRKCRQTFYHCGKAGDCLWIMDCNCRFHGTSGRTRTRSVSVRVYHKFVIKILGKRKIGYYSLWAVSEINHRISTIMSINCWKSH